jgi:serine/threonine-protein kinase
LGAARFIFVHPPDDPGVTEPSTHLQAALAPRYALGPLLAEGGTAHVWRATDTRHARPVAIKVLKPELALALGPGRFLREIRAAAQLQHPGILPLYDSGESDGLLWYAMPLVDGESLRDRLRRERQLPIEEAVRIARELAGALAYAHARGLVHRDVKPENVLLQQGHPLLADFGIAKALGEAGAAGLTSPGTALGTPAYMSPEQATGAPLDGRADQYALGCVLYETLAGAPPFSGPDAAAVLARQLREPPPSIHVVRATVPEPLEAIVRRALAKAPDERHPDMEAFEEALHGLEMLLTAERAARRRTPRTPMPSARTPQPRGRTPAPGLPAAGASRTPAGNGRELPFPVTPAPGPRRPAWRRVAIGVGAGLVLLAAGMLAWRARTTVAPLVRDPAADPRRVAVLYFTDRSPERRLTALADGLTEELIGALASVQDLDVVSRNGVEPWRLREAPRDSVARALRVGTLVVGEVEPAPGDSVRVTVRLVDRDGTEIDRRALAAAAGEPLALRDTLTGRVADVLRARLGEEVRVQSQRAGTRSADAWVLLQRAEAVRKGAEATAAAGDTVAAALRFAEADSLARAAEAADERWTTPVVFQASLAYRRSRLAVTDPLAAGRHIERGLALAGRALARDSLDADALELRGNLRYWRWLLRLDADPTAADITLAEARADLERSVRLDPLQAGAWGSLSHLYYQAAEMTDVLLAARRAYEADAWLENAATIVDRLFSAAYDLDQPAEAARWCAEGVRRFPADARFTTCRLYLMTMRGRAPDPAEAWRLAGSAVLRNDPQTGSPEYLERQARMITAAVLGRAGLRDSARRVIAGARGTPAIDPSRDLDHDEAFAQLQAGDTAAAMAALKRFLTANPEWREGLAEEPGWWFRALAETAEWKRVVGEAPR